MADLAGGLVKVTAEETTAEQPVSEALAQKMGAAINAFIGGITDIKVFTSSGTWTKPDLLRGAIVICTGRGGNGHEGFMGGGGRFSAGGGGAGGTAIKRFAASELGASETVTISTNTTFGAHLTAPGGSTGEASAGGAPGQPSDGQINIAGGYGASPTGPNTDFNSRGGHGGASFWGGGSRPGASALAPGAGGGGSQYPSTPAGSGGPGICIVIELF